MKVALMFVENGGMRWGHKVCVKIVVVVHQSDVDVSAAGVVVVCLRG